MAWQLPIDKAVQISLIVVVLYLGWLVFKPFFLVIAAGLILAILVDPLYVFFRRFLPKQLAAILCIVVLLLIIILPLYIFVSAAQNELSESSVTNPLSQLSSLEKTVEQSFKNLPYLNNLNINLQKYTVDFFNYLSGQIASIAGRIENFIVNTFLIFLTVYQLLINKEKLLRYFFRLSPFSEKQNRLVQKQILLIVNHTVRGRLLVIIMQTVAATLGFFLFGASSPFLFGGLYGLLSVIPIFGSVLVWLPFVAIKLIVGQYVNAVGFSVWALSSNLLIDHYAAPVIIGRQVKINSLLLLLAILGGVKLYGLFGIVLGPVILALLLLLLKLYHASR